VTSTPHDAGISHATGESIYIDDRPLVHGELHVGAIMCPHAHAEIKNIQTDEALKVPGCIGIYTANDLEHNKWGTIFQDQPILAEKTCQYAGEVVALVAAESLEAMKRARKAVDVEYKVLKPILSIDESIEKEMFIGPTRFIRKGNADAALEQADFVIEDVIEMKGQDHFYLESQACIAYPGERNQIIVHSSSQHPSEVQHVVAHALGRKYHEVVCVVNRMGGAFGGKESQAAPIAAMAALVTAKTGRAARLILTKDEDMQITGKRNPFKNFYKVGFSNDGKITGLKVQLYSDAGAYADLSTAIMERAMLHCDNTYFIPNAEISGTVCKTNTASNTAFRGFGGPKGVATIENILEEIAQKLGLDSLDVRKANVYQEDKNNQTPYGQILTENPLPFIFERLEETSNYAQRRADIERHNKSKNTTWRGLAMTGVKFGISFTTRFLNQGNALVNVHMDGTVQVSTGATEMGQGVNTKIAQVVAEEFGLPFENVRVMETSTEKNHNTSPTAASSGSDINCAAAANACYKIKARLAKLATLVFERPKELRGRPVAASGTTEELKIDDLPGADHIVFKDGQVLDPTQPKHSINFVELLEEAYLNRISLGDYGFYRYPGIHFNKETGQGQPFFYYTNGAALSEVSIDRFTGELKVLSSEILMDLGRPINEGIDRGQTLGGFVQGMGWVTTEHLHYNNDGQLMTYSPSTYKIPSVQDIPRNFQLDLIDNPNNSKNIRGSKAVGEPPLLLSLSVWTAIKNAIYYANSKSMAKLRIPATQEEIFMQMPQENQQWL
jgi:xanthine dehydrogenase large subunit